MSLTLNVVYSKCRLLLQSVTSIVIMLLRLLTKYAEWKNKYVQTNNLRCSQFNFEAKSIHVWKNWVYIFPCYYFVLLRSYQGGSCFVQVSFAYRLLSWEGPWTIIKLETKQTISALSSRNFQYHIYFYILWSLVGHEPFAKEQIKTKQTVSALSSHIFKSNICFYTLWSLLELETFASVKNNEWRKL